MDQPTWSPRDQSILGVAVVAGGVACVCLAFVVQVIAEISVGALWPWLLDYPYPFQAAPWFLAGAALGALLGAGPKLVRGLFAPSRAQRRAGGSR